MNTFSKDERLSSKKVIQELFKEGSNFFIHPFRVFYLPSPAATCKDQVLFSVPRRNFKRAVDRNLIKRRLREAYRVNKAMLDQNENSLQFYIAFVYIAKNVLTFDEVNGKLKDALLRLQSKKSSHKSAS
jgi:ribonuclease P protein component